ncbi:hypothetical protein INT45_005488 [Circinella minor]|uniref:Uncharacterized protein n=1 Tax=Circinella minor TaxID=1195481 RepID=A0A8H7RLY0_9FUNG|nr:hypothetical protein INT45_005488 [Circinella minor]
MLQEEFVASEEELVRNSERCGDQSDTTLPYNPGSWLKEGKVNQESQDILLGVELTSVEESSSDDILIMVEQDHNPRSNHISGGRGRVAAKSNMVRSGRVGRPRGRRGATFR